uniref:Uncharacterized protein n=1 Tax=viral metagenome TaxID=1070528 RepID=A0A6H2A3P9_9ZZZZ
MNLKEKEELLRAFKIPAVVKEIEELGQSLNEMEKAWLDYTREHADSIGRRDGDCELVKVIEAELLLKAPELNEQGKKLTVVEKEAWLTRQRVENLNLKVELEEQRSVGFQLECYRIDLDNAKRRLNLLMSLLRVREVQIRFLGSEV